MKKLIYTSFFSLLILLSSCGGHKDSSGKTLSPEEENAVEFTKEKMGQDYNIVSTHVYTGDYPIIFSEDYGKAIGLFVLGQMFNSKVSNTDVELLLKVIGEIAEQEKLKHKDDGQYITVMSELKNKKDSLGAVDKYLFVFKQPFDYQNDSLPTKAAKVTEEIKGLAGMIVIEQTGIPYDSLSRITDNKKFLEDKVSDPVLRFILEPVKE